MFTLLLAPLGLGGGRGVLHAVVFLGRLLGRLPRRLRLRDERAIAKVRELRANTSAPFFIALGMAYDRGILTEEKVRGNETLEGLRELYLMFEPPGNHP